MFLMRFACNFCRRASIFDSLTSRTCGRKVNFSMTKLASCIFTMWSSCAGQTCYLRTCKTEKFSCRQENTHCQAFFQNSFSSLLSILVGDSRDFWIHILKHFHILFCWSIVFLSSWCYDKVVTGVYKFFCFKMNCAGAMIC